MPVSKVSDVRRGAAGRALDRSARAHGAGGNRCRRLEAARGRPLRTYDGRDPQPGSPTAMANALAWLRSVCFEVEDLPALVEGLAADGYPAGARE